MPPTAPIPIAAVLIAKNRRRDILFLIRVMIPLRIFDAPCRLRADMCASADGPHKQTVVDFQNKCLLMASALPLKYRTSARAPLTALGQHYRVAGVRGRGRAMSLPSTFLPCQPRAERCPVSGGMCCKTIFTTRMSNIDSRTSTVALCQANRRGGVAMRGTGAAVGEAPNYWLPGFKHCCDPEPMDRGLYKAVAQLGD
jgi:hypothetical protein